MATPSQLAMMLHFSLCISIFHITFCICVIRTRLSLGPFVRLEPIKTPPMKEIAEAAAVAVWCWFYRREGVHRGPGQTRGLSDQVSTKTMTISYFTKCTSNNNLPKKLHLGQLQSSECSERASLVVL